MKRILTLAILAAVLLVFAAMPSNTGVLRKEAMTFAGADSFKVAASADTIISGWFDVGKCQEFLGAEIFFDRVTGTGDKALTLYFQGRVGTAVAAAEFMWICNVSDSLRMSNSVAITCAADFYRYFVLSVSPFGFGNNTAATTWKFPGSYKVIPGMYLPYDQVRFYLYDANTTLGGHCHGTWLYR